MTTLPAHYELSRAQFAFSALSLAAGFALLIALAVRVLANVDLWQWWVPLAVVIGMAAADFGSGLVHWAADTWGRDDLPVVGHRLLVPFRVHHINPDDLLRRNFVDANGDVAFVSLLPLTALLMLPLDIGWGAALAVTGLAFCSVGMMTNQIHQWAHMPEPPWPVQLLQQCHVILRHDAHAAHHAHPYDARYCITTGWLNGPLEAIGFFRRAERAITALTGARPRDDDGRYAERHFPGKSC